MTDPRRAGVIVAGGRSTRFPAGDKALAELGGVPLIRQVADRLAGVTDELVVNCRRDQAADFRRVVGEHDPRFAVDPVPDRGPVAGLETGLRAASAAHAFATACDMPFVDPSFVDYLFDRARGRAGAVPTVEERPQPLCAVYRAEPAIAACEATLAADSGRLRDVLARLDSVVLDEATVRERTAPETFKNLNTGAELAAVETDR